MFEAFLRNVVDAPDSAGLSGLTAAQATLS
jgi:hypothetical protein